MVLIDLPLAQRNDEVLFPLLAIWEGSVKATHHFLADGDFIAIKPMVWDALQGIEHLVVARDQENKPLAFLGCAEGKIEMLFVAPSSFGLGIGRQLVHHAATELSATELDVNEQNEGAQRFYEAMGFIVTGRSEKDGMGKTYPLLKMILKGSMV